MKKNSLLIFCIVLANAVYAQDGSLDATFGTGGFVITPIGFASEAGYSTAIQPDGKIVVAGAIEDVSQNEFALVRYNTDGSLDTTFDIDGKVTTPIGTYDDNANSLAIQSDGKIVVSGQSLSSISFYPEFALVRYNTNGSLDTTFDTDGIVTTDIGPESDWATSVAIQSDGKIVQAGYSNIGVYHYFTLVRYNTNGSLDTTFDTDGIDTTGLGNTMSWCNAVTIQNDGKIVAAGFSGDIFSFHFTVARFNTDGSLDSSFDADGKVTTTVVTGIDNDGVYALAIQSDDKIVAAGFVDVTNGDFALARYNSDGSLDSTFDADGIVTTQFGSSEDAPTSIAIQGDGKIVVAGRSLNTGHSNFALARYNSDGSLDTTFDSDGKVTTLLGIHNSIGFSIALQSDGKIVMVGAEDNGLDYDFAVVRYNNTINTGINSIDRQLSEIKIYPNPFTGSTTISFSLSQSQKVSLKIFDVNGRLVSALADNIFEAGEHQIEFNAEKLNAGIYFLKMQAREFLKTEKLIITK